MRRVLLLACLLALPTPAHADTAIAADAAPPAERQLDLRLGLLVGGNDVGDVTGPSSGLHASLGYRVGGVELAGEYGYLHVGDGQNDLLDRDGRLSRLGATLRWEIADVAKSGSPVGLEWWLEGGAGLERVAWDHGGLLYRPDVAVGFGLDVDGRGWREPHPRHFGAFIAFRALLARAPDPLGPAMCEGPCTEATQPSRNDASMYFLFGLHWGR
jgi:hypothetical protein